MKKTNLLFLSKSEIRGIAIVLFICLLLLIISTLNFVPKQEGNNPNEEELMAFLSQRKQDYESTKSYDKDLAFETESKKPVKLFEFDPNTMNPQKWQSIGLTDFQIKMITNYTSKGGKFKTAEDFSKIYGIDPELYLRLKPYIKIDTHALKPVFKKYEKKIFSIEINAAIEEDLLDIPGIGPGFAKRIINYRQRIGGYFDSVQLLEVFGMDTIKYRQILPYFVYQKDSIHKKEINKEDFRALIKHPYISKKTAYRIIQYRQQFGDIKSINQLKKAIQLPDKEFEKLINYILF